MTSRRILGYVSSLSSQSLTRYGTASGGTGSITAFTTAGITYNGVYFNSDGTLTVTTAGLFDVLMIGGGGAASYANGTNRSSGEIGRAHV